MCIAPGSACSLAFASRYRKLTQVPWRQLRESLLEELLLVRLREGDGFEGSKDRKF